MSSLVPKTTYYRRLRRARELGCPVDELPDNRGRHDNHIRGSSHCRWNNGRLVTPDGYALVRVGVTHPLADPNGYCREHVLVMCAAIGRNLRPGEVVHHKNRDRLDNRLENLELMTAGQHTAIHNIERGRERDPKTVRFVCNKSAGHHLDVEDGKGMAEGGMTHDLRM